MSYLKQGLAKNTPQSQAIEATQVQNSAGGFVWEVSDWTRLQRFLILGSQGGSYYASEQKLTKDNADAVIRCIKENGARVVDITVEISDAGRAPKNDPALFVLALCASIGDDETRKKALESLDKVARIGTHLLQFASFADDMRGWGRGLRNAVGSWYNNKEPKDLVYQVIKYQSRGSWSQRDLLRLTHPKPQNSTYETIFHWITRGWKSVGDEPHSEPALRQIWAMERLKRCEKAKEAAELVEQYKLPREAIPTQFLTEQCVWEAMLRTGMPMTALIRNLATLTRLEIIKPNAEWTSSIADQITDEDRLGRARIHPLSLLTALKTYEQGRGERGSNTWKPVQRIVDALDEAFYKSFGFIEPTNKRFLLALDVSGSMDWSKISGMTGITPRVGSAAMALVTAATEKNYHIMGFSDTLVDLKISPRQRLDNVIKTVSRTPMGATDCALPMVWAKDNNIDVDVFCVYTDSETWCGKKHPSQALKEYRDKSGIAAKSVVVGMLSNSFTIADPNDAGMMDVVGFDTSAPQLISEFAKGGI